MLELFWGYVADCPLDVAQSVLVVLGGVVLVVAQRMINGKEGR